MEINRMFSFVIINILIIIYCASTTARLHPLQHKLSSSFNVSITNDVQHDRINALPGQPENIKFSQYGGYIVVDEDHGKAFYYYFVEIDDDHPHSNNSTPLVLWLNGGPGCSSMEGAMSEIGPFRVKNNGRELYKNPYAWNKVANVLFLDTPAGVGFSYSNKTSDSVTGDKQTSEDNYAFLVKWLDQFPEHKGKDLYLTGESYAGHYVPQLAEKILEHNKNSTDKNRVINLKGVALGNPQLEETVDFLGKWHFKFLNRHDYITDEEYEDLLKSCDFSVANDSRSQDCHEKENLAVRTRNEVFMYIDPYNIYAHMCQMNKTDNMPDEISIANFDACTQKYTDVYLNTPDVQLALHASVNVFGDRWLRCNNTLFKTWKDKSLVLPILSTLLQNNIRILIYSGNIDYVVPYTLTREVLKQLNLTPKVGRTPWYSNNEFAGISEIFEEGLTIATVRGAGHTVPNSQPERALTMIASFLKGQSLPDHP